MLHTLISLVAQDEAQILLHTLVQDICLVFANTACVEYPVFTLFTKCLTLELIQIAYSQILDSTDEGLTLPSKTFILDLIQNLLVSMHSSSLAAKGEPNKD